MQHGLNPPRRDPALGSHPRGDPAKGVRILLPDRRHAAISAKRGQNFFPAGRPTDGRKEAPSSLFSFTLILSVSLVLSVVTAPWIHPFPSILLFALPAPDAANHARGTRLDSTYARHSCDLRPSQRDTKLALNSARSLPRRVNSSHKATGSEQAKASKKASAPERKPALTEARDKEKSAPIHWRACYRPLTNNLKEGQEE